MSSSLSNFSEKVAFIWSVADLLRGDDKPSEYVPLKEDIDAYMAREVLPHVPDARPILRSSNTLSASSTANADTRRLET